MANYSRSIQWPKLAKSLTMAAIIGHTEEMAVLKSTLASKEAELIAIYGRRRIGNHTSYGITTKTEVPLNLLA